MMRATCRQRYPKCHRISNAVREYGCVDGMLLQI